tara:strand:+ start:506 stop:1885 length:1380 start_codon:yes stop_codon:yes gene_type:complete
MSSIFIFRRDFRNYDNIGFLKCIKETSKNYKIYPIFIFTPEQIKKNEFKSDNAVQFMVESLQELNKKVKLNLYYGHYLDVLKELIKTHSEIKAVYTNTDYTPYAIKRDQEIGKILKKLNIKFKPCHDITFFEPKTILNLSGGIYQKFTPFYHKCLDIDIPKPKKHLKDINIGKLKKNKYSIDFSITKEYYKFNSELNVNGGRKLGKAILKKIKDFKDYDNTKNILAIETTHLSAYLKFGCLSIRETFHQLVKHLGKNDPLIRQLIWREFYYHLGHGFIEKFGYSLKEIYDNIKWKKNPQHLEAWKKGETGFPIIDACMTEINRSGYMHNRGRLLVASFLIKNLGIDWREGEKYFAQSLVDYDVLVNNGNWQWVSGSGADSQQYIRVFNPELQSKRYDSEGEYIKYWLPQLKEIPSKELHEWSKYHKKYDIKKINYYQPIIDYKSSKEKVMRMYKKALHS